MNFMRDVFGWLREGVWLEMAERIDACVTRWNDMLGERE